MMEGGTPKKDLSWLALVAETAGVAGAGIARIDVKAEGDLPGSRDLRGTRTCVVQAVGKFGEVLGATSWTGEATELAQGINIALGYDLMPGEQARIVGWVQRRPVSSSRASYLAPPAHSMTAPLFGTRAMKLMLRGNRLSPAAATQAHAA